MPGSAQTRAEALQELRDAAAGCARCPKLVAARTQVVLGSGSADAELLLVGEAPGVAEDRDGVPLSGEAGGLLHELLAAVGVARDRVAVVTLVRCRTPDNRNPLPGELESCHDWLAAEVDIVRPAVVCPLGNFATRVLRGSPEPVGAVRGRPEIRAIAGVAVRMYPLLHPAAALYTPDGVAALRADVAGLPALLALGVPEQPVAVASLVPDQLTVTAAAAPGVAAVNAPEPKPDAELEAPAVADPPPEGQLELF